MTAARHEQCCGVGSTTRAGADDEIGTILRWTSWGSLLPGLGWVYGVGTLWMSKRFALRDKIIGSLLFPGGWFGAIVAVCLVARTGVGYCWAASVGEVGSSQVVTESGCVAPDLSPVLGIPLILAVLVAAALGPIYLRARARR